jgi:hypothetical protein
MAAITCRRCSAVVGVQSGAEGIEVSYGSSFRESCKTLRGADSTDFLGGPEECPDMQEAIKRGRFRIARSTKRAPRDDVPAKSAASPSRMASVLEKADSGVGKADSSA